jgi:phosphoribosylformimino-5-aminoimidazole carboxamide ribotide isomerase
VALRDPDLVRTAAREFPGRVAVGIDAKGGKVAVEGWAEVSEMTAVDLAKTFEDDGVTAIIHTDIDRDGVLEGVNVAATLAVAAAVAIPVIASGGVANVDDVVALKANEDRGIAGAIIGRALYEGTLEPTDALAAAA